MPHLRYDGFAAWYDEYQAGQMRAVTDLAESLTRMMLPSGVGSALDLGCGTARHYKTLRSLGYDVVGVDLSTDQLQRARTRGENCAQADAVRLPFPDGSFQVVVTIMTATDFDDLSLALTDARRVVANDGHLVLVMAHPCFGGVFEEGHQDGSVTVFPGYRDHRRFEDHPLLGAGIRSRVGTVNVPLPVLLNAVSDAGWRLEQTEEDERASAVPILLGIRASAADR
jgi:ubiquinone/menaquinone biosynthesis C-methylase UbiE